MTAPAITIGPSSPVAAAARVMLEEGINRLPVVDQNNRLLGIVTRTDLVRAFARSDEAIGEEIRHEVLARVLWTDPAEFEVDVRSGDIELDGELETSGQVELLHKLVERTPGVVSLRSRVRARTTESGGPRWLRGRR